MILTESRYASRSNVPGAACGRVKLRSVAYKGPIAQASSPRSEKVLLALSWPLPQSREQAIDGDERCGKEDTRDGRPKESPAREGRAIVRGRIVRLVGSAVARLKITSPLPWALDAWDGTGQQSAELDICMCP